MRANMRSKNGHKSGPRASPMARIWHAPSYHIPKGFFHAQRGSILIKYSSFTGFSGGLKVAKILYIAIDIYIYIYPSGALV